MRLCTRAAWRTLAHRGKVRSRGACLNMTSNPPSLGRHASVGAGCGGLPGPSVSGSAEHKSSRQGNRDCSHLPLPVGSGDRMAAFERVCHGILLRVEPWDGAHFRRMAGAVHSARLSVSLFTLAPSEAPVRELVAAQLETLLHSVAFGISSRRLLSLWMYVTSTHVSSRWGEVPSANELASTLLMSGCRQ